MIHFETRAARYQPCPHCGRHTLIALDEGATVRADPEPLTLHQEIAARLQGKTTYDVLLYGFPRRMYPTARNLIRIRAPRHYAVIADHRCIPGTQRPAIRQPETEITVPYPSTTDSEQPLY
jgi:hypothetical protein